MCADAGGAIHIFKHLALTGAPRIGALLFTLDVVFSHVAKMKEHPKGGRRISGRMRLWNSWDRDTRMLESSTAATGGIFSDDGDVYLCPKCRALRSPIARPSLATASASAIRKSSPSFTSQIARKTPGL